MSAVIQEVGTFKKMAPLKTVWGLDGCLKYANHSGIFSKEAIGWHFSQFEVSIFSDEVFRRCVEKRQIEYMEIQIFSVNLGELIKWISCLEPVIENDRVTELHMTAMILESGSGCGQMVTGVFEHEAKVTVKQRQTGAKIGYWDWDFKTNHITWSDETWKLFDLDQTQFEANYETYMAQIHPEDQSFVAQQVEKIMQDGEPYVHHIRINPFNNYCTIVECRGYIVKNHTGEAIKLMGSMQDITWHLQLEKEYEKKYNLLNLVNENAPGMVSQCELSPGGELKFLFVSNGCQEIYGVSPEEILLDPNKILSLTYADDVEVFNTSIEKSAGTLGLWDLVFRVIVDGKLKWLHGKASPIKKPDSCIVWDGVVLDITNQKRLEGDLRQAEKETEVEKQANRTKNKFLASLSHELRTPLNAINGFSELLLDNFAEELNHKQRQYIQEINKSGQHLLQLINGVLDIAKIEQEQTDIVLDAVNVEIILLDLQRGLEPILAAENCTMEIDVQPKDMIVETDKTKLKQILLNIVYNAIQYSHDSTVIKIKGRKQLHNVFISVVDQGIGVALPDQKNLFKAFFQVNPSKSLDSDHTELERESLEMIDHRGGLGLFISKQIVEMLGGSIVLKSDGLGKGTEVNIVLPNIINPKRKTHK